ncbi:metallophosphoesterase [Paenibacillus sp. CC-CFT747]|nr:metallophosphoesterase [Paenibacillus sp. CC-CFT747]
MRWLLGTAAAGAIGLTGLWRFARPVTAPEGESVAAAATAEPSPGRQAFIGAAETGGALLSFAILSDLHINPDLPERAQHLRHAFDDLKAFETRVEAVIMTGDQTDYGRDRDYKELAGVMKKYKLPPVYANMGNHDYYNIWMDKSDNFSRETMPNGKTDEGSRRAFQQFFEVEKPYSEGQVNGFTFLMMSQEAYVQEKPEVSEGCWYSEEQLKWLEAKLAGQEKGRPVFVMIHQPLPEAGSDGGAHRVIPAKRFRAILKGHPNVFVFSGHTHQDFKNGQPHYVKESFHWFQNSSVGRVLNRQFQNDRENEAQGLYVQVFEDKVVVRAREFTSRSWIAGSEWKVALRKA